MDMDERKGAVKEAFERVKSDMKCLQEDISFLTIEINDLKTQISSIFFTLQELVTSKNDPTHPKNNPTHPVNPTDNPTLPYEIGGLKCQNLDTSIRNRGVPTVKQSNNPTDNPTYLLPSVTLENNISEATELISNLDIIKKEIRHKFKTLTTQEMLIFTTIYQLEEQLNQDIDYRLLSQKLSLSESSIRDYVNRLIKKGIPLAKIKFNNKKISLKISENLKKIASLQTILNLREN
jgi:hypothetical protein